MNEEQSAENRLMESLADIAEWTQSGLEQGGDTVITNAPLLAQQYVAYVSTMSAIGFAVSLAILLASLASAAWGVFSKVECPINGGITGQRFTAVMVGATIAVFAFVAVTVNLSDLIKAKTAPMLLVVEKVADLMQ